MEKKNKEKKKKKKIRKSIDLPNENIWDEFKRRNDAYNKKEKEGEGEKRTLGEFLSRLLHIEFYFGEEIFDRFLEVMQVYYNDSPAIRKNGISPEVYARGQFITWIRKKEEDIVPYITRGKEGEKGGKKMEEEQ